MPYLIRILPTFFPYTIPLILLISFQNDVVFSFALPVHKLYFYTYIIESFKEHYFSISFVGWNEFSAYYIIFVFAVKILISHMHHFMLHCKPKVTQQKGKLSHSSKDTVCNYKICIRGKVKHKKINPKNYCIPLYFKGNSFSGSCSRILNAEENIKIAKL